MLYDNGFVVTVCLVFNIIINSYIKSTDSLYSPTT